MDPFDRRTIADAQRRLRALGHDASLDPPGTLGEATAVALQAFQRERGLPITGHLDPECYARIVEAGWRLGDRLLYLDRPFQRGDDVAALQEALAQLGFNPGRVDGIFGPLTEGSLKEFQRNVALAPSGVLTRQSLAELIRLSPRGGTRHLVTEARDTVGLFAARRLVVVSGVTPLADAVAVALEAELAIVRAGTRNDSDAARLANEAGAGLLLQLAPGKDDRVEVAYFSSYRAHSVIGRELSEGVARRWAGAPPLEVRGMSVAILRETVMPAVIVAATLNPQLTEMLARATATATVDLFNSVR